MQLQIHKKIKGFSLIELLVTIAITGVLIGGGLGVYTNLNQRQLIKRAGSQMYNDLRLTQGWAINNEKPPDSCNEGDLSGYKLRFTNSSRYVLEALCSHSEDMGVERVFDNVVLDGFSNDSVDFYILGQGAQDKIFCLEGFNLFYEVEVTQTGEIIDNGLVEGC